MKKLLTFLGINKSEKPEVPYSITIYYNDSMLVPFTTFGLVQGIHSKDEYITIQDFTNMQAVFIAKSSIHVIKLKYKD